MSEAYINDYLVSGVAEASDSDTEEIQIKRKNFDDAILAIQTITENTKELDPIDKVKFSGGLFGLGDHKVTGSELNRVVDQVEDRFIDLKNADINFINLIDNIVKALVSLDKEYISGILSAASAAKVASDKATRNVERIDKIVKVLEKHKNELEKLKHLHDVDKAWKIIEELQKFNAELNKLNHLKEVDKLWESSESQKKSIKELDKKLDALNKSITDFLKTVKEISDGQSSFIDSANRLLTDRQGEIDHYLENQEKALRENLKCLSESVSQSQQGQNKKISDAVRSQTETLDSIKQAQAEKLSSIDKAQTEKLTSIEKVQSEKLAALEKTQTDKFSSIEKAQSESLKQIAEAQSIALAALENEQKEQLSQIAKDYTKKLEAINKSLDEEKAALTGTVTNLTQKVKTAYIVAGASAAITVIHLILNIMGVL